MQKLVDAGALPKIRLDDAARDLADAQDRAILDRTLYGNTPVENLTEQMGSDMVAAAQRRLDRQKERIPEAGKLVDDGILARNSIQPLQDELSLRQNALQLAQSRANLIGEMEALEARAHQLESAPVAAAVRPAFSGGEVHYEGNGAFNEKQELKKIEAAFQSRFKEPLPISADGETDTHRALGFDHRGRVDVALSPQQEQGQWLLSYLKAKKIPFYAFTHAIPGKATGAHIHIGPGSTRLQNAD